MRPVSERFLATLTGSHNIAVRLRAVPSGQTGTNPTSALTLICLGGDVQMSASASIRSSIDVDVAGTQDDGLPTWPAGPLDILTPFGAHELYAERGVAYGGGVIEYVSLGYFRVNTVEQPDAPDGPISIGGTDRMSMIVDSPVLAPLQFAASETYAGVLSYLVNDAYPSVIEWDSSVDALTPIGRTAVVESDRYAFLAELLTGIGKEFFYDYRGVLVVRTPLDPANPVWTVAGGAGGVMVSASRSLAREGVYNGVIATGEGLDTSTPTRGVALDSGETSPTRWGGPFGKIARSFSSSLLTTDQQCRLAAATILRQSVGLPYNVNFDAIPNPALEAGDPVVIGIDGVPTWFRPEVLVGDSFSTAAANGINPGESGAAWSTPPGGDISLQVTGGTLRKTWAADNTASATHLPTAVGRRDAEVQFDAMVPNVATGATLLVGAELRYVSTSDRYLARLEFDVAGALTLKLSTNAPNGDSAEVAYTSFASYTAGQWWRVRARAVGDAIYMRAWPRDETEPGQWMLTMPATREPGATSRNGLFFWRVAGNTNNVGPQLHVDNYVVRTASEKTLINGELHVVDTLSVPLTVDGALRATTREQTLIAIETGD